MEREDWNGTVSCCESVKLCDGMEREDWNGTVSCCESVSNSHVNNCMSHCNITLQDFNDKSCDISNYCIICLKFILPSILLVIFNILVISGNLLVILAFCGWKKLRTHTNMYILSLACADLFLGVIVLPSASADALLCSWPFGADWCYIWLAVDVWLCTASILNLCVISYERYFAISRPLVIVTSRKAKLLISFVWISSFVICAPALIWRNHSHVNVQQSQCELTNDIGYVIYSALGSFWIPVWIIAFFYGRIYVIAVRNAREMDAGRKSVQTAEGQMRETMRVHVGQRGGAKCQSATRATAVKRHSSAVTSETYTKRQSIEPAVKRQSSSVSMDTGLKRQPSKESAKSNTDNLIPPLSPIESRRGSAISIVSIALINMFNTNRRNAREMKAIKTVGIIVGCFFLCWGPFFTVYPVDTFCEHFTGDKCTPGLVRILFVWLGYCNSAFNPCIYALFSKDFRFAFKKLLRCRCERKRVNMRQGSKFHLFLRSLRFQIQSRSSDETPV